MTELPYWPPLVALALGILAVGFAWYRSKTFEGPADNDRRSNKYRP